MAPIQAIRSLPLPMRCASFLLPTLAALALASCTAPPPPPPPTASVPPPASQQLAPPPPPPPPPATPAQSQVPFVSSGEMDLTGAGGSTVKPGSTVKAGPTVKPGSTVERTADQFKAFSNTIGVPQSQQEAAANLAKEVGLEVRSTGKGYYEIGKTLKGGRVSAASPPDQSGFPVNTAVADYLNDADGSFGDGGSDGEIWGCRWVSRAIYEVNNSQKPTGPAQRAEVKRYADRCKLRFQP